MGEISIIIFPAGASGFSLARHSPLLAPLYPTWTRGLDLDLGLDPVLDPVHAQEEGNREEVLALAGFGAALPHPWLLGIAKGVRLLRGTWARCTGDLETCYLSLQIGSCQEL